MKKKNAPGCRCCVAPKLTVHLISLCGDILSGVTFGFAIGNGSPQSYATGASGSVVIPGLPPGTTVTITASIPPRYADGSTTVTTPSNGSDSTVNLLMLPADGFVCFGCASPISKHLVLSSPVAGADLFYSPSQPYVNFNAFSGPTGGYYGPNPTYVSGDPFLALGLGTLEGFGLMLSENRSKGRELSNIALNCPPRGCPIHPLIQITGYYNETPSFVGNVGTLTVTEVIAGCAGGSYGSYGQAQAAAPTAPIAPEVAALALAARPPGLPAELIVARYTEDTRWVQELAA